jgi:hypothetical protein
LDADLDALMGSIEAGFSIRLIATPREQLKTCRHDEPLGSVVARNVDGYDFLPVTRDGSIVGIVRVAGLGDGAPPSGLIADAMAPLSEANLIGADAGILSFLRDADARPCRLVLAGSTIVGLVSLSDLQRLPVRPVLFFLITHLEMLMAAVIRSRCSDDNDWRTLLSDERQAKLDERLGNAHEHDMFIDALLGTEFADKITILAKSGVLAPMSRKAIERELQKVKKLRDQVAHAGAYAWDAEAACRTCATVRLAEAWIERLRGS